MIKALTRTAVIFLIVLSSTLFSSAQSNYAIPRPVGIDRIVRRSFPSFYVRSYAGGPMQRLYADGFYPIGWSRDGKFAYYFEPVDEACGCYFGELIVQDMRTDKILWHFKNDWQNYVDAQGAPIEDDIERLWKRNQKMFAEKLREYKIEQAARFALLPTTFRVLGRSYTAKLNAVRGNDPDGNRRIQKLDLELRSPTLGKKSLYSTGYKGEDMWGAPLDSALAGVFKSPFENRVAVVMLRVQRGYEGPPHTVDVQIAGADLLSGFRK